MAEFDERVIMVTGAGGGIGAGTARLLASEGARLALVGIPLSPVRQIAEGIVEAGGQAVAMEGDISSEADVIRIIAQVRETFGRLDGLDNCAAATSIVGPDINITETDVEDWDRTFAVNVRGTMLMIKHSIPLMLESGGGAIVNISSQESIAGDQGLAAYCCSKAAINQLTRSVATQYGKAGIRCNTVAPGLILSERAAARNAEARRAIYLENNLMARLGCAEDVAHAVAFMLSDRSSYANGSFLMLDGGSSAHHPHWAQMQNLGRSHS